MKTAPSERYIEQAKNLSPEEIEQLLSRARYSGAPFLADGTLSVLEKVAIQLEEEDKALNEWRNKWAELRHPDNATLPPDRPSWQPNPLP